MRKWILLGLSSLTVLSLQAGKIERAYEALEVFNYFKAKELFYRVKDKEPVASPFGLSLIYGRNDNPFYQLDSAFLYITIADSNYHKLDAKDRNDLNELGVDSMRIENWKDSIDYKLFVQTKLTPSIQSFQDYLDRHKDSPWRDEAKLLRNNLAFQEAKEKNSALAYKAFMLKYPDSKQIYEAQNRYEERLYKEKTEGGRLEDYRFFVKEYPESPFLQEAQDSVYFLSTPHQTIQEYYRFIQMNEKNPNTDEAWRNIYKLYTSDYSPQRIVEFRIDYPDFPFVDELVTDMKLAVKPFLPFRENGLWGFMDTLGEVMITAKYQSVEPFKEGLALVVKAGRLGYIDKSGETIIPFDYEDGESFQSGLAIVSMNDKYGLIDRTNRKVVPLVYDLVGPFNSGLAVVANDTAYGYVNKEGRISIPLTLEYAGDFYNGYAQIEVNGKKGVINTLGKVVIPTEYQWLESFNRWELARAKNDSMYGLLDKNGAEILPFEYDRIGEFSDGLAMVVKQGKYGYVNYNGDLVIDVDFDYKVEALIWGKFESGYAKYLLNQKFGIIDTSGEKVFPAIFEDVGKYHESQLVAVKKRGVWGYSNQNLRLMIPYKYEFAETFMYGTGKVKADGLWGVIDEKKNWVVLPEYDKIERVYNGEYILKKGDKFGLVGSQNDSLLGFIYEKIKVTELPYLEIETEDDSFYYNLSRRKVIKPDIKN